MILIIVILVIVIVLSALLIALFGLGTTTACIVSSAIIISVAIVFLIYYNLTRRGRMILRAWAIMEIHKDRIAKEILDEDEDTNPDTDMEYEPSADESSTVGHYGCDAGDGDC